MVVRDERVVMVCEGVEVTTEASNADDIKSDSGRPKSKLNFWLVDIFAK